MTLTGGPGMGKSKGYYNSPANDKKSYYSLFRVKNGIKDWKPQVAVLL